MKHASDWGIEFDNVRFDMSKAVDRSRRVSNTLTRGIGYLMRKNNITVIKGTGRLMSSSRVQIDGNEWVTAQNIIIATGARARSLPGLEIDGESIITSREALELREQPKAIAIVGASAIGCEFAYYFNAYGVEVMLFELLPRIVPKEDEEVSAELERQFKRQGIKINAGSMVKGVEKNDDGSVTLSYTVGADGEAQTFTCDKVLLGVGVQPNSDDVGLASVGIQSYGPGFIEVDGHMRTNASGVYAVGDVTGKLPLAHVAFDQGIVAAETIAGHDPEPIVDYLAMPRCTYCHPQIASLGITEGEAKEQGLRLQSRESAVPGRRKVGGGWRPERFCQDHCRQRDRRGRGCSHHRQRGYGANRGGRDAALSRRYERRASPSHALASHDVRGSEGSGRGRYRRSDTFLKTIRLVLAEFGHTSRVFARWSHASKAEVRDFHLLPAPFRHAHRIHKLLFATLLRVYASFLGDA